MIQDDYLMRLLNNFAKGMARILARKAQGDQPGALDVIADTMHELFGLQPQFFHRVSESELAALLKSGGRFNAQKAFIMAELLREHAEVVEEMEGEGEEADDEAVIPFFLTAVRLYADALTASEKLRSGEFAGPFHLLCERLEDYALPVDLLARLMGCHQIMEAFSKAEDTLYRLMDADERRGVEAGLAFYEGLLERTDEDLEAGGLPRDEVKEGLDTVQERRKTLPP